MQSFLSDGLSTNTKLTNNIDNVLMDAERTNLTNESGIKIDGIFTTQNVRQTNVSRGTSTVLTYTNASVLVVLHIILILAY